MTLLGVMLIGGGVGFLGGLFGKGGSAIATPMLATLGIPPIVAVAAPLPATIPGTLAAARRYRKVDLIDIRVLKWTLMAGLPATVIGAVATRWISGGVLVKVTDVLVLGLGLRLLLGSAETDGTEAEIDHSVTKEVAIAVAVGLAAGLLANSGGFLMAPLYLAVLHLPVKPAMGTSLVASAMLAIPGTVVHAALGHIDWLVVLAFGLGSIPLSSLGAMVALRTDSNRLQRVFGAVLVLLGGVFLLV